MSDPIARLNAALEGRYRIERQIGEGGMATVYLAEDIRHERKVALKVLKPELAAVVGAERFLAEIKTTANLQHPHILPLHDSGEADGFLFFVMPYVEGETLRDRLESERLLGVGEAVEIAKKVASALDYAHAHGVVHRDIKPGNILLSERGEPTVADFGIALAVAQAGGGRVTETGLSMGTPHYMSPEQATGERDVDPRTDVYALGCVLYEMLVGEPPHTGTSAQAVLAQILTADAVSPVKKRASIPPNVDAAIRKALEKLPADRFQSAQDFAGALSDPGFRHGAEASAAVAASTRGLRLWALTATAVAVLFGITTVASLLRPEPPPSVSRSTLDHRQLQNLSADVATIDVSPDGSRVVFVGVSDGTPRLWLRSFDRLEPRAIEGTDGARYPRISPDGSSVAFIGERGLTTASLVGGTTTVLAPDSALFPVGGLAWGADHRIYFIGSDGDIRRVPAAGGDMEVVGAVDGLPRWPEVLPNGEGLLFSIHDQRDDPSANRIVAVSLETGDQTVLVEGSGSMPRYAASGHVLYTSPDATLLALPFDADGLRVTGPARSVMEDVAVSSSTEGSDFAISRNGVLVYRTGGAAADATTPVWLGRDGSEEALETDASGRFRDPAISPDARRIAFEYTPAGGTRDIWIYDLDQGGTLLRLTLGGSLNNWHPFWSPDGREVGFSAVAEGGPSIYSVPWDRSAPPRLLRRFDGQPLWDGSWSPDGTQLVYRRANAAANTDLLRAAPDPDSAAVPIAATPFQELAPSLSPDGRWLAYQSDESGRFEIYVRPFPGPGGYLPVSVEGGVTPVWAHSGREIVYRNLEGTWMSAAVRTDPVFTVESREVLFPGDGFLMEGETAQFDLSPDDQRILAIRTGRTGSEVEDIVVQGFFEELKREVPAN